MTEAPINRRNALSLALTLELVALTGCDESNHAARQTDGRSSVNHATLAKLTLTSDAFKDGQPIPVQYSCDGANQKPVLHWDEPPPGTKSFAFVIDDPDAPGGTFRHWGVYDIPSSMRTLGGGQRIARETGNDFGTYGYRGPCPPEGHAPHHYHFKLFALDVDRLDIGDAAKVADVELNASRHAIAKGELIGTYERK